MQGRGMRAPRRLVVASRLALGLLALFAGAVLWAERAGGTSGAAFQFDVLAHRLTAFPTAVHHRNARCTYADVWSLSPPVERTLAQIAVRKTFQVTASDRSLEAVRTPAGAYWIPARDIDEIAETITEQQSDIYESGWASVRPGDVVLDCGANVGLYTRHALDKGARLVVAIEPAPEALECLRRNLRQEMAAGRVIVYPKGVWNQDGELSMSASSAWASSASSLVLDRGGAGPRVPLTTIDKLVSELHLPSVDFIKMDIEGAEMQALEGARGTVRRFHPRLAISLEHRPSDPERIPAVVARLWPNYTAQCGPCANINGSIQPDVLFARPR